MRATIILAATLMGCAASPSPSPSPSASPPAAATTTPAPPPTATIGEPVGAACKSEQTPCGNGPHAACCSAGEMCCAGGAAGSYYCRKGTGMCPPLP